MVVVEDELAPIEEVIAEEEARPSGLEEPPALKRRRTEDDPDAEWMEQMGKFSQQFSDRMSEIGFERLVAEVRGKPDISPEVGSIPHPAAVLLEELRTVGARVEISTEPLTAKQLDAAAEYGSHGSCVRGLGFICREMLDFIEKGFYMVLPFDQVRDLESCADAVVLLSSRVPAALGVRTLGDVTADRTGGSGARGLPPGYGLCLGRYPDRTETG